MSCMTQQWLDPIVRVQTLSESGLNFIPNNYIKPFVDRPDSDNAVDDINLPVIDIGGLVNGSIESSEMTMLAISNACKEWGFFQVVNHGVSGELIRKMKDMWREFFHLPMEEKTTYANLPTTFEGYGSRLGVKRDAILDWGDYFFLQLFPESVRSHDKWPKVPTPSLSAITEEYSKALMNLCKLLTQVLSLNLGLDKSFIWKAFGEEEIGSCMRVNYYPKCPQPGLTLGLSAHSDPGGLTVLMPDYRVKGLQVRKNDEWITVKPVADAFIVNVGDQIQVLSNAIYKSVEHRVTVNSAEERLSVAFFYNPRGDLPIGPAQELVNPVRPALYKPVTFNEYRLYMRKEGPSGKSQIETLKQAE
ncbi:hypothetical protein KFK09_000795 [Dendrobium nobile]|uniref:Fe2OG dioxygenase domain-containing protein n=1 Tax=Dendrobium nobile TaxID=94219 RepID=A0A8T3CCV4_DENNO|nr:hypothetical protein KFK09_000795 [Dendrobium nobile]